MKSTHIKGIKRNNWTTLYKELYNSDWMVKFPERYKLPKLLKKNFFLNNYVSIKEREFLVKNLSNKKQNKNIPGPDGFTCEFKY